MANRYFIWKDPDCNGVRPEWIELSGDEFFKFITKSENKHRRFIKEFVDENHIELGYYKFEVNGENFREWETSRKQKQRSEDVLIANKKKSKLSENDCVDEKQIRSIPTVVSFDAPFSEENDTTYHDIVPDTENGFEDVEKKWMLDEIYRLTRNFPKSEREVLDWLYFDNPENKLEVQIANEHNVSHQYIYKVKKKIEKKLKKLVADS